MANITIRIDDEVKVQLQNLVAELGLDITTYFTMAAKQAIREQRIPFIVSTDNSTFEVLYDETFWTFNNDGRLESVICLIDGKKVNIAVIWDNAGAYVAYDNRKYYVLESCDDDYGK